MTRQLEPFQKIEQSITKKYRKKLWNPFLTSVNRYELIQPGDRIAACISGGKDSMLMAKMLQMLQRYTEIPFELVYLVMDPGYTEENRKQIEENAARLDLPIEIFESEIFAAAEHTDHAPCYLCARMRRGNLYSAARDRGCNKIALGHHYNDVIETTLLGLFYGAQLQAMLPKLHSQNFPGMELIRPIYCVREEDIIAWAGHNDLHFMQCGCRLTQQMAQTEAPGMVSKRREMKELIRELKKNNPDVEKSIFHAVHTVHLDTFPGYKSGGEEHTFLEKY